MAKYLNTALVNIRSHLEQMDELASAEIGLPRSAPTGPHAAVFLNGNRIPETTLNKSRETRTVTVRFYENANAPADEQEILLDKLQADFLEAVFGGFELGGEVVAVMPVEVTVEYGWSQVPVPSGAGTGGPVYRVCDVNLPLLVDDSASFAP